MGYSDPSPDIDMFQIKTVVAEDITIIVFQKHENVFLKIIIKGIVQYICLTQEDTMQLIDALISGAHRMYDFKELKIKGE